jgi:hypothetical protein
MLRFIVFGCEAEIQFSNFLCIKCCLCVSLFARALLYRILRHRTLENRTESHYKGIRGVTIDRVSIG